MSVSARMQDIIIRCIRTVLMLDNHDRRCYTMSLGKTNTCGAVVCNVLIDGVVGFDVSVCSYLWLLVMLSCCVDLLLHHGKYKVDTDIVIKR